MKKLGMMILSGVAALGLIGLMATVVFAVSRAMHALGLVGGGH